MNWKIAFLFSIAIFPIRSTHADILFVDLNNSTEEYNVIKKEAELRGEKVVILPVRTDAEQAELNKLRQYEVQMSVIKRNLNLIYGTWDAIKVKIQTLSNKVNANAADQATLKQLNDQYLKWADKYDNEESRIQPELNKINDKISNLKLVHLDDSSYEKAIASYEGKKDQISTVIFSGHHDGSSFMGLLGSLNKSSIEATMKAHPKVTQNIKSAMGWGCYSLTLDEREGWWNRSFPACDLLGGYDALAAGAELPADAQFLGGILHQDASLRKIGNDAKTAHDVKLITKLANSIPGFSISNSALCTKDVYVGKNSGSIDLSNFIGLCTADNLKKLQAPFDRFSKIYASASSEAEDIPCNGENSWLRKLYSDVRIQQHCAQYGSYTKEYSLITAKADQMIRLIDFDQVFKNFNQYFQPFMKDAISVSNYCGIKVPNLNGDLKCTAPPTQNPSTPKISRYEIFKWFQDISSQKCFAGKPEVDFMNYLQNRGIPQITNDYLNSLTSFKNTAPPKKDAFDTAAKMKDRAEYYLHSLLGLPLSWVNPLLPGSTVESPSYSNGDLYDDWNPNSPHLK